MDEAHSSENRWTSESQGNGMATVNAALVDLQRSRQTASNESRGAVGHKRHKIVDFRTPYKRPTPSSGRKSIEVMMMTKV
ncbi:jg19169 [Pararge aegeria aegeria]|uniref:Jg19169 protein n=1 Tax=Pararge aegeria aegeria TaxID=348720 RepID=A0A8S4SAV5_9NEOP|nr:jg19169 [Pararge aegeria aegeria]